MIMMINVLDNNYLKFYFCKKISFSPRDMTQVIRVGWGYRNPNSKPKIKYYNDIVQS